MGEPAYSSSPLPTLAHATPPAALPLPPIFFLPQEGLEFSFTPLELLLAAPTSAFCLWYYLRKHWFANNMLGMAFR